MAEQRLGPRAVVEIIHVKFVAGGNEELVGDGLVVLQPRSDAVDPAMDLVIGRAEDVAVVGQAAAEIGRQRLALLLLGDGRINGPGGNSGDQGGGNTDAEKS